jgi:hypothetical protein
MPKEYPISKKRHITAREWLRLLPWDMIYALGVVVFVLIVTLLLYLISHFS